MCWEEHEGQSSLGMTSAAAVMKGKDLETSNPTHTHRPCVKLPLYVANLQCVCVFFHAISVCGCALERVCMHVLMSEATGEC